MLFIAFCCRTCYDVRSNEVQVMNEEIRLVKKFIQPDKGIRFS